MGHTQNAGATSGWSVLIPSILACGDQGILGSATKAFAF